MRSSCIMFNPFTPSYLHRLSHLWIWIHPLLQIGFQLKINNRIANSVDPDETTRYKLSHLDLLCLQRYLYWPVEMNRRLIKEEYLMIIMGYFFLFLHLNICYGISEIWFSFRDWFYWLILNVDKPIFERQYNPSYIEEPKINGYSNMYFSRPIPTN